MDIWGFLAGLAALAITAAGGLAKLKMILIGIGGAGALATLLMFRKHPLLATVLCTGLTLGTLSLWQTRVPTSTDLYGDPAIWASIAQQQSTLQACEAEMALLPDRFALTSVVDEVTALDEHSIVKLLSLRKLAFLEIKVQRPPGKPASIIRPGNPVAQPWRVDSPTAAYVRLEVVAEGSLECPALASLPDTVQQDLKVWPLPPGTCLQTRFETQPSASHALDYQRDTRPGQSALGHYRLLERTAPKVVAQLATSNHPNHPIIGSISQLDQPTVRPGCQTPHTALADRLVGIPLQQSASVIAQ
ncbi:MAG: hypothetical protein ABWY06_23740 [Pseudomonas sp.]|uniref:hypothetical protein n=1 Tax=Pseudomonas sp. TaxID=306 RepID=UPI003398C88F